MTSARTPSRRLLLVADRRPNSSAAPPAVRRFRLARLGISSRPAAPAAKRA